MKIEFESNSNAAIFMSIAFFEKKKSFSLRQTGDAWEKFIPSGSLEKIGEVPGAYNYKLCFKSRPWKVNLQIVSGDYDTQGIELSSTMFGLQDTPIATPDSVPVSIVAKVKAP